MHGFDFKFVVFTSFDIKVRQPCETKFFKQIHYMPNHEQHIMLIADVSEANFYYIEITQLLTSMFMKLQSQIFKIVSLKIIVMAFLKAKIA